MIPWTNSHEYDDFSAKRWYLETLERFFFKFHQIASTNITVAFISFFVFTENN